MRIRHAIQDDLSKCLEIMKHDNLKDAGGGFPDADYVGAFIDGKHFFVADIDGEIAGLIAGEPIKSGGFLMHYFVADPKYSKYQVGDALLKTLSEYLIAHGFKFILGYANAADTRLINLYKRKYGCYVGKPHSEIVKLLF